MLSITSLSHAAQPPVAPAVVADITLCLDRSLSHVTSVLLMSRYAPKKSRSDDFDISRDLHGCTQHMLLTKVSAVGRSDDLTF